MGTTTVSRTFWRQNIVFNETFGPAFNEKGSITGLGRGKQNEWAADVDSAFDAAERAFPAWSSLSGASRADVLRRIAAGVKARHEELSRLEATMGKLIAECKWDVDDVIYCFEYYAGLAAGLDARQGTPVPLPDEEYKAELRYHSMGVAACVVPWNYPLLMAT